MRLLLLAALVAAAPLATSQPMDPVEHLAEALALSPDQADLVAEILVPDDPGATWTLAAELLPTLDEAQRAALFARPERPEGGRRAGAGRRGGGEGRGRRDVDPALAAVRVAARDAALGLDADLSAALDAALEGLDRREAMRAMRDGELPDAVAAVLSEAQAELFVAHVALQRHVMRARRSGRSAR